MKIVKHQQGGTMPTGQEPAPAQQQQQDPLVELLQLSAQALQNEDCQAAMGVCQGLLMLAQSAQQGQPGAPTEPQGEPVFKKGGKIVKKMKKNCK